LLTGGNGQQPEQMIPMMSKGAQRKSGLERQEEVTLEPRAG